MRMTNVASEQALMREQLRIEQLQGSSADGMLKVTCRYVPLVLSTSFLHYHQVHYVSCLAASLTDHGSVPK